MSAWAKALLQLKMPQQRANGGREPAQLPRLPGPSALQQWLCRAASSRMLDRRSLRVQLTLRVWLLLIVLFTINNSIQWSSARQAIITRLRIERQVDSEYLAYGVRRWSEQIHRLQTIISEEPEVQRLDPAASQKLLAIVGRTYPYRTWRLYDRQANVIASTGSRAPLSTTIRQQLLRQRFFQQSLAGLTSHVVGTSPFSGVSCMTQSVPVYAPTGAGQSNESPDTPDQQERTSEQRSRIDQAPVGVLSVCLPLESLGNDSGLNKLADSVNMILDDQGTTYDRMRLNLGDTHGTAFLLLSEEGYLLFPSDRDSHLSRPMTPEQVRASAWGPFLKELLKSNKDQDHFSRIQIANVTYLAYTHRIDPLWRIALVVDTGTAFGLANRLLGELVTQQILILILSAVVIFWTCSQAAWPVQRAGTAVRRIATGDFDVDLPSDRRDEIGNLYRDIHNTADQLRHFVAEQTSYAVTRGQIETGRAIQRSFLVEKLPQSDHTQLATSFNPALDVAGDWYDAIPLDSSTAIVIADVCDKGVGAALFMSVFRTLLRFELLNLAAENKQLNSDQLRKAVTVVNDYMAETHGDSAMFATTFVAIHDPERQSLSYICGGHELPFILRRDQTAELERLTVTGPAVGIFGGSNYQVKQIPFGPGDVLFAFTDGLTDARSPLGEAWGADRLSALLDRLHRQERLAVQELVDQIMTAVGTHMAGAAPFDDLTVIALRAC